MSTRVFRTIHDFVRHRCDIEVTCYCGHRAVLARLEVVARFNREGWPIGLAGAASHFRCKACGSCPANIAPAPR
ncbi:MAG TPA: hypothetical protein VEB68_03450 [Croceibacterium sp.]|nr:hypothetical protein [Croceibacterium sp.]